MDVFRGNEFLGQENFVILLVEDILHQLLCKEQYFVIVTIVS